MSVSKEHSVVCSGSNCLSCPKESAVLFHMPANPRRRYLCIIKAAVSMTTTTMIYSTIEAARRPFNSLNINDVLHLFLRALQAVRAFNKLYIESVRWIIGMKEILGAGLRH